MHHDLVKRAGARFTERATYRVGIPLDFYAVHETRVTLMPCS